MKHCLLFKVGQAVGLAEHLREFLWHAGGRSPDTLMMMKRAQLLWKRGDGCY